ncbi:MAG: metallophosphoesterase family protein, partial [Bacillota bacterium]
QDVITDPYNNHLMHYNPSFNPTEQDLLTGAYYSFDYSGVHFVVLNTNDIDEDNMMSQTQIEWLEDDLENNDKEHVVVSTHKGLYTAGSHAFDEDVINMREQLSPIFEEYGVNIVFGGHDHTYTMSYYLDGEGNPVEGANHEFEDGRLKIGDEGTLYVTMSTVGDKYYQWKDSEDVDIFYGYEMASPMFGKLMYDGEELYFEAYEYNMDSGEMSLMYPDDISFGELAVILTVSLAATGALAIVLQSVIRAKKKKSIRKQK